MSHALRIAQLSSLSTHGRVPVLAWVSVAVALAVTKWDRNFRTRRHLKSLSPEQLDDVGVDRLSAHREAEKPFWRD